MSSVPGGDGDQSGRPALRTAADFRRLWAAQAISQLGSQITLFVLPLVAVRTLGASTTQVGILAAAETLPFLLIGLPAGAWVDRRKRRPLLIGADLVRAAALATIPVATLLDRLTFAHLCAAALVAGFGTVVFDVAYQSFVPSLLPTPHLLAGNARLELSSSAAQVAGPGLAGAVVAVVRAPFALGLDAISFLVSALFLSRIQSPEPPVMVSDGTTEPPSFRSAIVEGLRLLLSHPVLRRIALRHAVFNLSSGMAMAAFYVFALRTVGVSAMALGIVFSLGSVGFVLGAAVSTRVIRRLGVGRAILFSGVVQGAAFLLVPLAQRDTAEPLFVSALLLESLANPILSVAQLSLRQSVTPNHLRGRMTATMRVLVWGVLPIGSLAGGVLGGVIGVRATLWIAATIGLASSVALASHSIVSVRDLGEDPSSESRGDGLEASVTPGRSDERTGLRNQGTTTPD